MILPLGLGRAESQLTGRKIKSSSYNYNLDGVDASAV